MTDDIVLGIILGILLYTILCFIIALIRALFASASKRKQTFLKTFWAFFRETLDPFTWLS